MFRAFILFIFCFFVPLFADEEIVVHLNSSEKKMPIFFHFVSKGSFEINYVRQLEDVLAFDLNHNGHTQLAVQTKERMELAKKENSLLAYDKTRWQDLGIEAVVRGEISDKTVTAAIFSLQTGKIHGTEKMRLTGHLPDDRRVMHQIADAIHLALFGKSGIADTRILYTVRHRPHQDPSKWISEVWESDYDGANARQITHEEALCITPTYIPSTAGRSSHFLFVSYKIGQPKIYVAKLTDGIAKRLTFLKSNQLMPTCTPLSNQMAFISDVAGNPDLFVQDFSPQGLLGKPRQIFSAPQAAQGCPSFSPDGKQLAFVSNKDGTPRIYALAIPAIGVHLDQLRPTLISRKNQDNTSPAWSPDGKKIAYSAMTHGVRQIWMYDFNTKEEVQLTEGVGHKENPTWASDSFHLIFNSSTTTSSELYLINLNQKEAVQISHGSGEKRFPAWEWKRI